ncbi:amino acid racemase [Lactobacillus sp. YT155]|uniref:aspartate/glutamate racemase family protein n=1 Tax=Lactobacillus sp. YT155 TaxID=3060955 RepID=UPI00265F6ACA|nr:amino acid racemase [Lactobacillus sp. YT155]MDO1604506.1 amino acid racemase [Lactobacillus sp. YT155]
MKNFFTVLGGMGTAATESFVQLLNEKTPAKKDQDYLNYIIVNHASIPDRSAYLMDHNQPSPLNDLVEDIQQQSLLKPDFFVIACNTAHYFYEDLQKETDIPILHMPRLTVQSIQKQYPRVKKVGILGTNGTVTDGIYDRELEELGYEVVKPTSQIQEQTMDLIFQDIKGKNQVPAQKYHHILQEMKQQTDCDAIILGCTELSLAQQREPLGNDELGIPIIDAQAELVNATIKQTQKI